MEETDKIRVQNKLPSQEIDYFKIGKILLSRWYWIVASVAICMAVSYTYLWYTPKIYATSATMKFEEKKTEFSDLATVTNAADKGPSRVQGEIFVIQSAPLILSAIRDLDYRISFYVGGRVRTTELYPEKPLDIQLLKFDSLSYYNDLISFQPLNATTFRLSYNAAGKSIEKVFRYNTPVTVGPTSFSIKYPGEILSNIVYIFKFNTPETFLGRVGGGLRTSEIIKNSNIISLQETDSNPQFAADALNALMKEYLKYDHDQKTQSATQMIYFIQNQLDTLAVELHGSANLIEKNEQDSKIIVLIPRQKTPYQRPKSLNHSAPCLVCS
jgi:tyrosine-protein kinase Etk/Wzc